MSFQAGPPFGVIPSAHIYVIPSVAEESKAADLWLRVSCQIQVSPKPVMRHIERFYCT